MSAPVFWLSRQGCVLLTNFFFFFFFFSRAICPLPPAHAGPRAIMTWSSRTVAVPTRCSVRARPMIRHRDDPAASNTPAMEEHFGRDRRAEAILKKGALPAVVDALLEHLGAA